MKKNPLLKFEIVALAAFQVVFATSSYAIVPVSWNASVDNTWENALNWTPALEPTNNTFDVEIGLLSSSPCNLSSGFEIDSLTLSTSSANLNLVGGALLAFTSDVTNNGTILVNSTDPDNSTSTLRYDASVILGGTGIVTLNGNKFNRADIVVNDTFTLTQGVNHTIQGKGDFGGNGGTTFVNDGVVNANAMPRGIVFGSALAVTNNNLLEATGGNTLTIDNSTFGVDQTGGGTILATGAGSVVQLGGNTTTEITKGTLDTASSGIVDALSVILSGVTNNGDYRVPGTGLTVVVNGITDNGTMLINSTDPDNSTSALRFDSSGTLGGNGTLTLNGNKFNRADIIVNDTFSVTNGANHTIVGKGDFGGNGGTTFVNDGVVNANAMPRGIVFGSALAVTNNNLLEATGGNTLTIDNSTFGVDQTGGGTILATGAGSVVQLGGNTTTKITNGILNTTSGGIINGLAVVLSGVTNDSDYRVPGNNFTVAIGSGITDNKTILINSTDPDNSTSFLRYDATGALDGTGVLTLNGNTFNRANIIVNDTFTLTQGADHTIQGKGDFFGNGGTTFVNNGLVNANATPRGISINGGLAVTNNNLMEATNGSQLTIDDSSFGVDQTGGGTILATGPGSVVQLGGATNAQITGGTLNGTSGGVIKSVAGILAGDITNSNAFEIPANGFALSYATTLTNNGTITLDANTSFLRFDQNNTAIGGTGTIALTNGALMQINAGQNVSNGPNHTIKGNGNLDIVGGSSLTNNGTIAPGLSPGQLNVNGDLELGSTSNLAFEVGGTGQGTTYDWLNRIDGGMQTLGGSLHVRLVNGFTPANSDTFTIFTTQQILAGSFSNVMNGGRLQTDDGAGSFQVTYNVLNDPIASRNVVLSDFQPTAGPPPCGSPTDADGGGFIASPHGGQATFTMDVKFIMRGKRQRLTGSFGYEDPAAGFSFSAKKISSLTFDCNHAQFSGTGRIKKTNVTFTVDAYDNGSSGDQLFISISNGYSAGGMLTGGIIQFH